MQPKLLVTILLLFFVLAAEAQTPAIDSLKKIIALNKRDTVEARAFIHIADEFSRRDVAMAKKYAFAGLNLTRQFNMYPQMSAAYSQLTTFNAQTNQLDSAKYYLGLLKKLADENINPNIKTNYYSTAGLFYRKQGYYKASLPFLLEAVRELEKLGDKRDVAGQCLNVGNNYSDMGDYRNAMSYHLKALKLFETIDNKRGLSFCYSSIGADFIQLKQYNEALPYVQQSIALKNELKDKKGIATGYLELGDIQMGLDEPDKALANYLEAVALNKTLLLPAEEAKADLAIAKVYAQQKDISNANDYFNRSGDLFKKLGDTVFLAVVNAEETSLQKNFLYQQKAEKTYLTTLSSSIKVGDKNTEINNYKHLADFYAENKQYDKALIYNEKYHSKSDSLQNNSLQLQVKELEERYNLEKKEKEISLLKKDQLLDHANLENQKLFRYGAVVFLFMLVVMGFLVLARYRVVNKAKRLIEIEKMRNSIARNLHDDIGSTLSSINILSKVTLAQAGGNTKVQHGLEKIKDSSFTIMESMSDIVWAINPANDPLDKTILKMREFAATILEPAGVRFTFNEEGKLADLKLGVDERKNLFLIFKEAINNVAKYSGATLADIALQRSPQRFLMKIADNGKGFDDKKQYNGNGLKNMQSRSGEMNAFFEIISKPEEGTIVSLAINIT